MEGEEEVVEGEEGGGGEGCGLGVFKFSFLRFKDRIHNEYNGEVRLNY